MPNTSISFPLSPTQGQQYIYESTAYIFNDTSADMLTSAYPAGKDLIFKITYIAES